MGTLLTNELNIMQNEKNRQISVGTDIKLG